MRTILVAALFLSAASLAPLAVAAPEGAEKKAAAEETGGMPWKTSYSTALKDGEAGKKPILFDFHTGWCPHCTRMDKTTWKDEKLVKLATDSFVVAKINADVEKAPVSRYRLTGYPTVIVAEPGGDQVLRMEGYKDAAAISAALKAYLGSADKLTTAFATLRTDKKNVDALMTVGNFHASVGLHSQAGESFQKALKAAGDAPSAALLLALVKSEAAQGRADSANGYRDRLTKSYPGSPEANEAEKALAGAAAKG